MKKINCFTPTSGLTFIELMIVIAIISFSLPLIFGLLFINLRSQSKTAVLQEVKRNGDFALQSMGFLLRQYGYRVTDHTFSQDICPVSPSGQSSIGATLFIVDRFGKAFSFFLDDGRIASSSPVHPVGNSIANQYFTNEKVVVSNLEFACWRATSFAAPIVSVSFAVNQSDTGASSEEGVSLHYATRIRMRN